MNDYLKTSDLPEDERPYEKCERFGAKALKDEELLAIIIRTGLKGKRSIDLAWDILHYGSISNNTKEILNDNYIDKNKQGLIGLNYLTMKELKSIKGIGRVKAIQLLCVVELAKRLSRAVRPEKTNFNSPDIVARYFMQELRSKTVEMLILVMLDSKNNLIKCTDMSVGTVNSSIVPSREIFITALENNAVNIILLHNHPTGDPYPSKEDINSTKAIKKAGEIIGIRLIDHIIIGDNIYISLNEMGLI